MWTNSYYLFQSYVDPSSIDQVFGQKRFGGSKLLQEPVETQDKGCRHPGGHCKAISAGVNFINILFTHFSYKHLFLAYFLYLHVSSKIAAKKTFVHKFSRKTLMKLTTGKQNLNEKSEFFWNLFKEDAKKLYKLSLCLIISVFYKQKIITINSEIIVIFW